MVKIITGCLATALLSISLHSAADDNTLVAAVKSGDIDTVSQLLENGVDVDLPAQDGTSALAYAAYRNDLAMIEMLLIRGEAEVNITNDYGATPLYTAAANSDAKIIQRLLNNGADPNAGLLSGETPLMVAALRGKAEAAQLLLEHGANPDTREGTGGQTALMWASAERHPQLVELLLEHKADVNIASDTGFTALMFAAQKGDVVIAETLIKAGAQVDATMTRSGLTPLMIASLGGYQDVARVLLDNGANAKAVDKGGKSVLHHAVSYTPSAAIVRDLLARGADPDVRLKLPKPFAGEGVNPDGSTPLVLAASLHNLDAVVALLDARADPKIPTVKNTTALMMAAGAGIPPDLSVSDFEVEKGNKIVKLLLELGADPKAVGDFGWTALHSAAYHGRNEAIQDLIAHGAKTEIMDVFGQTPLSIAYAILTEDLGDAYRQTPRSYREDTGGLLLSLGATPLEKSGVKIVGARAGQ